LPGNPVAALVGFVLFAQAAIDRLRGRNVRIGRISAISTEQLYGGEGRTDAIRGHLGIDAHARIAFSPAGNRGSGIVSSLKEVDCLALIPENRSDMAAGEAVEVCPIGVSMFKDGAN
jgi:molybdopterin molybdotransferase